MENSNDHILNLIHQYNLLMKDAISGPNCIDPKICSANCCHIQIDIPKVLAEYYMKQDLAVKEDFERGDLFSYKIALNPSNSKCIFYDKEINGCSLHSSMHKPPQCWIYPTGFFPGPGEEKQYEEDGSIKCKMASGWNFKDVDKAKKAKKLFDEYVSYCEQEIAAEITRKKLQERLKPYFRSLKEWSPKEIAGLIDGWDSFSILKSEGMSLKLKTLCDQIPIDKCKSEYMECEYVCDEIVNLLRRNLLDNIENFIHTKGPKSWYSFLEIWHTG